MRKSNYDAAAREKVLADLRAYYKSDTVSPKQLREYSAEKNIDYPYFIDRERKIARGVCSIASNGIPVTSAPKPKLPKLWKSPKSVESTVEESSSVAANVVHMSSKRMLNVTESFIPEKNKTYVPFGFFGDLKNIIKSGIFYPVYITGLSGNGKTFMIEQVCAALGRELIRVNITKRTDETDLIGSYELIDGNTVRREGPVVTAMRRGAVLLLDETDLGTEDLLCLQPILEGKPYFDKKTGEVINPAQGFNVIATANTKGKGSDDGRFIGTNVLNEAFLERFAITVEQEYPPVATERKILERNFAEYGCDDANSATFIDRLITWADVIRKTFADGAIDEIISTRRLVHIAKAYSIFGNRMKAIELCLNRFDTETKIAFSDLYTKVDADAVAPSPEAMNLDNPI